MRRVRTLLSAGGVGVLVTYGVLQWLGRTAGSTGSERAMRLVGDDLVARPHLTTNHAVTINAPPELVWPWLVQMGWHRGGWYTSRWVDTLLFPENWPAATEIQPQLQHLKVGDAVPDGAPETECYFIVRTISPPHLLALHSQSHLPPAFRDRFGAWIDWSWVFVLTELGEGRSRFLFRSRARLGPPWLAAAYWLAVVPADYVMSRQMLRGVKKRAELSAVEPGPRWPRSPGSSVPLLRARTEL